MQSRSPDPASAVTSVGRPADTSPQAPSPGAAAAPGEAGIRRRSFLVRLAGLGPGLVALQQIPFSLVVGTACAQAPGNRHLSAGERVLFGKIIERMVRTGDPKAPTAADVGALDRVELLLAQLDPALVDAIRTALDLVDWWPATAGFRFSRFGSLEPEAQDESLDGWRRSGVATRRRVFYALRNVALFAYWGDERTWDLIGYPGPWIGNPKRPQPTARVQS